ncbi:MAG: NADPH-dependent glutamate synthase [Anaerolineae bacterium]
MPQTEEMLAVNRKARMELEPVDYPGYREPEVRVKDFEECLIPLTPEVAMAEAARCLHCARQPCVEACPIGNEVAEAMWYVEHGDFLKAAALYRTTNALPEICGRVCPTESSCEGACVLHKRGKAIPTRAIEAFVADYQREHGGVPLPEKAAPTGKRVGVVGSGPAGLAAAEELARAGHQVRVYEALPRPGGLLVYGIPGFKLNKSLVAWKVGWLEQLGVEFITNMRVGADLTLPELMARDGLDALFLGTGAQVEASMNIPGEDLDGVIGSLDFLVRTNLPAEYLPDGQRTPIQVGKRVAVIGGGDTATDCLRTSLRLGAEEVICYYRRTEAEMPGNAEERHHAIEEGAQVIYLTAPVAILDRNGDGRADTLRMIRMELGEPDASGRRRPVPVEGSEYEVEVDTVVLAIGFWPDPVIGEHNPEIKTHRYGLFVVNEKTGQTSVPNIFAGGDNVTGPALVNAAVAAGRRAAQNITAYLKGELETDVI